MIWQYNASILKSEGVRTIVAPTMMNAHHCVRSVGTQFIAPLYPSSHVMPSSYKHPTSVREPCASPTAQPLPLDQFEVAMAVPVGDGFVVLTHFPAPRRHKMLHKVLPEILPRQLALLQQVRRRREVAR